MLGGVEQAAGSAPEEIVDDGLAEGTRSVARDARPFVAGCTVRMAQIFTGLRDVDPARSADLDAFLRLLDDLWDPRSSDKRFEAAVRQLEGFPELQERDDDEVLVDADNVYSFLTV